MALPSHRSKAHVLGVRIAPGAADGSWGVGGPAHHSPVRCPRCDGERVLLAAAPGQQPGVVRICLDCAALWEGRTDDD
jgi:hypothetical protein